MDLFFIHKQITIMTTVMQTKTQFCLSLVKVLLNFFSGSPFFPSIPKVSLSPNSKHYDMMNYYQHQIL